MDTVAFLLYFTNTPKIEILNTPLRVTRHVLLYNLSRGSPYNVQHYIPPLLFCIHTIPLFFFSIKKKKKSKEKQRSRSKFLVSDELTSFRIPKWSILVFLSAQVVLKSCIFVSFSSWGSRFLSTRGMRWEYRTCWSWRFWRFLSYILAVDGGFTATFASSA